MTKLLNACLQQLQLVTSLVHKMPALSRLGKEYRDLILPMIQRPLLAYIFGLVSVLLLLLRAA